jgi:hypothetical protein
MTDPITFRRVGWVTILSAVLYVVTVATPALAGGGNVLPPTAQPKGYSLAEIAEATAVFNTSGFNARSEATEPPVPFQILYTSATNPSNTFHVRLGTMFYVPIVFSDNSEPILGDFPDVNDPEAVSDYYFNPEQLGAEFIEIVVDGEVTSLEPEYAVGAETPGLPTGGDLYTVAAVFLTPLSKGTHTVTIRARLTGEAIAEFPEFFPGGVFEFEITYTVIVH